MASIFPGLTVIGPPCDDLHKWDPRILPLASAIDRQREWKEVGLDIKFEQKPYDQCDFSKFDVLIESVETFNYAASWKDHCHRVECPIIVTTCWTPNPSGLPESYVNARRKFPVVVQMPTQLEEWQKSRFMDVVHVPVPVGDWWFERKWTGSNGKVLFVLAGRDLWRPADESVCGVDWWRRIEHKFPGRTYHHDGALDFKTAQEMTELFAQSRVFVNLDRHDARALTTTFTEALAAGMPVAARAHRTLSYGEFIDVNGVCTNDFPAMCEFIGLCLDDPHYAAVCGERSRYIARSFFSTEGVRGRYEPLLKRAKEALRQ